MKIICFIFIGLALSSTQAQLPFKIGDTIPDLSLPANDSADLVIIDFWATWCGSCLAAFPTLDSLQDEFAQVQFLLVNNLPTTGETNTTVTSFIQRYRELHPHFSPALLIQRSALLKYGFPALFLPHYVWLNKDRVLIGITGSTAVTAYNIIRVLRGEYAHLPLKTDHVNYSH